MDDKQTAKPMTGCFIAVAVIVLAILYPLSAGPAVRLVVRDVMPAGTFFVIYAPLFWFDDHLMSDYRPFGSYVNLWFGTPAPLSPISLDTEPNS